MLTDAVIPPQGPTDPPRHPPYLQVSIGFMRVLMLRGDDMKKIFRLGHPGNNWSFGLLQLHVLSQQIGSPGSGVDGQARRWQPLVPLLIRSFQLTRDILLALPLDDHAALGEELCMAGLLVTLELLIFLKGGAAGQVWRCRCGLEAMKLVLDPEGAVQRIRSLRDSVELPLLRSAAFCMAISVSK